MTRLFTRFAQAVSRTAGKPVVFGLACLTILIWGLSGPVFRYSDTWQLVINTGTTIITFLMVFLIQNTQNRDGAALQAKLDELIRSTQAARNEFIGIENLTDKDLEEIIDFCQQEADNDEVRSDVRDRMRRMHAGLSRLKETPQYLEEVGD